MLRDVFLLSGSVLIGASLVIGLLFLVRLFCWPFSVKIQEEMRTRRTFHCVWACFGVLSAVVLVWDAAPFFQAPPRSEKAKREYGVPLIYRGAPFCCLYVGLWANETEKFEDAFWQFADQQAIRKPKRSFMRYSGPPLATGESDHVAVYVSIDQTTDLIGRQQHASDAPFSKTDFSWQLGFVDAYWPTNASYISNANRAARAPLTGKIQMAVNDAAYPLRDFKGLTSALTLALQTKFPDRTVAAFVYDGDKHK
jgi:hypothetical protein